jgi:electron transfer flavoprotein alpha subunit
MMDLSDLSALLGEELKAAGHTDIWVVTGPQPPSGAKQVDASGLLAEARRLADNIGCYVHAVVVDTTAASEAFTFGADRAHVVADPVTYLLGQQPEFVFFTAEHGAAAAEFAQRGSAGLIDQAIGPLGIDPETRALSARRAVYRGDYLLDLAVITPLKVAAVRLDSLAPTMPDDTHTGEIVASGEDEPAVQLWHDLGQASYRPAAQPPLWKANVIVAAGRGLVDEDGFHRAKQLATRLGAEIAGDRSVRGRGWIDEAREIGVTGQEVSPTLYVAAGVLGDTVHNAAIAGARNVVAIHIRADAPIFATADIAVVGEPKQVLAELLDALA